MEKIYIKNKELFKNKWQMLIYLTLFVLFIAAFIYLAKIDYDIDLPDNERFADTFNMVSSDNVFKYVNAVDVRSVTKGTKGIVLFGTSNEWVNYYAYIVNKVAKEVGIEKIYYYDFFKNRTDNNGTYEDIVNNLKDYVTFNDRGVAEIYAPSLLVVSDNKVLFFDTETTFVRGNITPRKYWNSVTIKEKEDALKDVFLAYLGE